MKVFVIGTGNVATSLGKAIKRAGHEISGVFGRNPETTAKLAKKLSTKPFSSADRIPTNCDLYLISIKDDAIEAVSNSIKHIKSVVVHTSGTTPVSVLKKFKNRGVFYPLTTITKNQPASFRKVPFCIEASNEATLKALLEFAGSISNEIYLLDSNQRAQLHLAAVFTNNFTNHLLNISYDILEKGNLPKSLISQLAVSTVSNAFKNTPYKSQTGPAMRNDKVTISKHLGMLKNNKGQQSIYKLLTKEIINVHKRHKK